MSGQVEDLIAFRTFEESKAKLALEAEDEERRRAGGGAGMEMPVHAQLGANIRPDVVSTPAGLETVTTQKSADYRPDLDGAREYIHAALADDAGRSAAEPTLAVEAGDEHSEERAYLHAVLGLDQADAAEAAVVREAEEKSAQRQEQEVAARSGAPVPGGGEEASVARAYMESILAGDRTTERDAGEQEIVQDQGVGVALANDGGRGMA